jgi:hypothetical protein
MAPITHLDTTEILALARLLDSVEIATITIHLAIMATLEPVLHPDKEGNHAWLLASSSCSNSSLFGGNCFA